MVCGGSGRERDVTSQKPAVQVPHHGLGGIPDIEMGEGVLIMVDCGVFRVHVQWVMLKVPYILCYGNK